MKPRPLWLVRGLGLLVGLLLTAGLTALPLVGAGPRASTEVSSLSAGLPSGAATVDSVPVPLDPPAPVAPIAHASPPSTASSPATAGPRPTAAGSSGTAAARDLYGPLAPRTVAVPFAAGRSSWALEAQGISIRLTIAPARPVAGQPVSFHVEATRAGGSCCSISLQTGDGGRASNQVDWSCPSRPPTASSTLDHSRVYARGGRKQVLIAASPMSCTPGESPPTGDAVVPIDVAAGGPVASQGPRPPVLQEVGRVERPDQLLGPLVGTAYGRAQDEDGYIRRFEISWGDGSPLDVVDMIRFATCPPGPDGWPISTLAMTPFDPPPTHHYATPKPHTITITAVSTGCDGGTPQSTSASYAA